MHDDNFRKILYLVCILLLAPALFINLGLMTFIDDEGIRSLVALEMKLSGNYITPTLNGAYYYRKPPLFNWILLAWFNLAGAINEFNARTVSVIALLGYAATLFAFLRKRYGASFAFLNAFVLITCGRILFWDSMLGLIDITFSWVTFTSFLAIYYFFQKKAWWALFMTSYLLTAVGFMLKGLPAIVFQGITLVAYFSWRRQFLRLFSLPQIAGGVTFLLLIGAYYWVYAQYGDLQELLSTLFFESSKRTAVHFGFWATVLHLLAFPLEMVYHFLPWSLLILYLFHRKSLQELREDPFITFSTVTFLSNILIYWTSPEVYPRYLLMLAPLLFVIFLYLHRKRAEEGHWQYQVIDRLFQGVMALGALLWFGALFMDQTREIPYRTWKVLLPGVLFIALAVAYHFRRSERLLIMAAFLLVLRIGFNFFVLPDRNANDYGDQVRQTSIAAGEQYRDVPMFLYGEEELQPTVAFYLTNARGAIIPHRTEPADSNAVFIIDQDLFPELSYRKVGEVKARHGQVYYDLGNLAPPGSGTLSTLERQ